MNISNLLHVAGVYRDDPEYGLQFNLMHASLGDLGVRNGLDHRVKSVLRARGLGKMTPEGAARFYRVLVELRDKL